MSKWHMCVASGLLVSIGFALGGLAGRDLGEAVQEERSRRYYDARIVQIELECEARMAHGVRRIELQQLQDAVKNLQDKDKHKEAAW